MPRMGMTLALAATAGHVAAMGVKSLPDGVVHGFNGGVRVGNKAGQFVGWVISKPAGAIKKRSLLKQSGGKTLSEPDKKALTDYKARVSRPFKKLGAGLFGVVAAIPGAAISTPLKFLYNVGKGIVHIPAGVRELRASGRSKTILNDLSLPDNAFKAVSEKATVLQKKHSHEAEGLTGTKVTCRNVDSGAEYTEYKMYFTEGTGRKARKTLACEVRINNEYDKRLHKDVSKLVGRYKVGADDDYEWEEVAFNNGEVEEHDQILEDWLAGIYAPVTFIHDDDTV